MRHLVLMRSRTTMSLSSLYYPITFASVAEHAKELKSTPAPNDWRHDRTIVSKIRREAIAAGYAGDNYMISHALAEAGISHLQVHVNNPTGPRNLDEYSHPNLFLAATRPEGDDMEAIVRAVGRAVDIHTPDALPTDRLRMFYGFIRMLRLPVEVVFGKPTTQVRITTKTTTKVITDVLAPKDPSLAVSGWKASPYTYALANFARVQGLTALPSLITKAHELPLPPQNEA